jgi:hypothetical protein
MILLSGLMLLFSFLIYNYGAFTLGAIIFIEGLRRETIAVAIRLGSIKLLI